MKKILLAITLLQFCTVFAQIKVFSDGKTSIGSTLNPGTYGLGHLIVAGSTGFLSYSGSATSSPMIRGNNAFSVDWAPDYTWLQDNNTGMFHPADNTVAITTNGNERIRFFSDGKVTIGHTQNYGSQLMINAGDLAALATYVVQSVDYGFAQVSNVNRPLTKGYSVVYNGTSTFNVLGNGWVEASGYTTTSDASVKENILPVENALSKILQLNGVTYNYIQQGLQLNAIANTVISTTPPKRQMGLIAQEVELIVPEVVQTNEKGLKGIAYQNLISLLIEGMKEQQQQIITLQQQINQCCPKDSTKLRIRNEDTGNTAIPKQGTSYLLQNRPNPFSEQTIIEYFIAENVTDAALMIFDLNGKLMITEPIKTTGKGSVTINGSKLSPGMYYYSLVIKGEEIETKKMIFSTKN